VVDELERRRPSVPERDGAPSIVRDAPPRSAAVDRTKPTRTDPAIVMMADRSLFCCWVEPFGDGDRWVFLSSSGRTYVGPAYDREDSLEAIGAVASRWWASTGLQDPL